MTKTSPYQFFPLVLFPLLLIASSAQAVTIHESEEVDVELRGLLEVGGLYTSPSSPNSSGLLLGMARISARARYHGLGRFHVQYEAAPRDARLLDAQGTLEFAEGLELRLGRFKTPNSLDLNIGSPRKPFPSRALVADLTPRRATGAEILYQKDHGAFSTAFGLGLFDVSPQNIVSAEALHLTARAQATLPSGLIIHLGYGDHLGQTEWPFETERPFFAEEPRHLDLALQFQNQDWFAQAEAVFAPHRDEAFTPAGLYLAIGHRFGNLAEEPALEPIVGYDLLTIDPANPQHRFRAGINAYLLDYRFVPSIHYELTTSSPEESPGQALFALLRLGI